MNRKKKTEGKENNLPQKLALGFLCLLLVVYTVYHVAGLFSGEIETVLIGGVNEKETVSFNGYLFRDETVLVSAYEGSVRPAYENGARALHDTAVVTVYETGRRTVKDSLSMRLDADLTALSAATVSSLSLDDLPEVRNEIGDAHERILLSTASRSSAGLADAIAAMKAGLAKESVLTDSKTPVYAQIDLLSAEKAARENAGGESETLSTLRSGYFYTDVDGYESAFTVQTAETMTPETFRSLISAKPRSVYEGGLPCGKMAYSIEWRLASFLAPEKAAGLSVGETYDAAFAGYTVGTIPLTLERLENAGNEVMAVFSAHRLPPSFDFARSQTVSIVLWEDYGLSVPVSATHRVKGEYYVYTLRGSVVEEKKLEIIRENADYLLCRDGLSDSAGVSYLQDNDALIVSGNARLFDGRILS